MMLAEKIKLGFLVSGRGSNMRAIIDNCCAGKLAAEPVVVISNNVRAAALEYARQADLPAFHLSATLNTDPRKLDEDITEVLVSHGVDWVILAGYMQKVGPRLLKQFHDRVLNIHPSLLPKHGGKGLFGMHVHQAVLAAADIKTGATVHLVNAEYDQGAILSQITVLVKSHHTAESLAQEVLKAEHLLYSQTLQGIIDSTVELP